MLWFVLVLLLLLQLPIALSSLVTCNEKTKKKKLYDKKGNMKIEFLWIQKRKSVPTYYIQQYSYSWKTKQRKKKKVTKSTESKELRGGFPTNNLLVGNYWLRRAEIWEDMPSISSEMGEI